MILEGKEMIMRKGTYRSFVGMNMTGEDYINFIFDEPRLEDHSHAFSFHVMVDITAVHWSMHKNYEPWCLVPVYLLQLIS